MGWGIHRHLYVFAYALKKRKVTKEELQKCIDRSGGFEAFMQESGKYYVEVQLWSDRYIKNS